MLSSYGGVNIKVAVNGKKYIGKRIRHIGYAQYERLRLDVQYTPSIGMYCKSR
jgi:hypothetical protein